MSEQILINYVCKNDTELSNFNISSTSQLTINKNNSISLSKLDLIFSKYTLPDFIVPVSRLNKQNEAVTPYKIIIYYCLDTADILNKEFTFTLKGRLDNIPYINGQLDNFNDRFKYSFNSFFALFNEFITDSIKDVFNGSITGLSNKDYKVLSPCFESNIDNIKYYCMIENKITNTLKYYINYNELNNNKSLGSFTIGFNSDLINLLFREWRTIPISANTEYFDILDDQQLYTETLDVVLTINGKTETYYINAYTSPKFYEYSGYIKSLLIVIDGLNLSPLYLPAENSGFSLINSNTNINSSLNVLSILQLDTLDKGMYRLSYSNTDQKNNSVLCNTDIKFTGLTGKIYYIDKYNNVIHLKLYKGDSITAVLAVQ